MEIIKPDTEVATTPQRNEDWVITKLEESILIKAHWSLDNYIAGKLLDTIENALAPDNKWELHIDYRTRLKWMETILKLKDKSFIFFTRNSTNRNCFNK